MVSGGPVRRRNNIERYDQDDFDFDGGFSQSDAVSFSWTNFSYVFLCFFFPKKLHLYTLSRMNN